MLGPERKRPARRLAHGYLASGLFLPAVLLWFGPDGRARSPLPGPVTGTVARACALAMLCALRSSSLIAAVTYCCIGSGGRGARNPAVRAVVPGCVALFSMRLARFGYPMLAVVQNIGVGALSTARKECGKRHMKQVDVMIGYVLRGCGWVDLAKQLVECGRSTKSATKLLQK